MQINTTIVVIRLEISQKFERITTICPCFLFLDTHSIHNPIPYHTDHPMFMTALLTITWEFVVLCLMPTQKLGGKYTITEKAVALEIKNVIIGKVRYTIPCI